MLSFHAARKDGIEVAMDAETLPSGVSWIDALRPDAREIAFLERTLKIEVPALETLSEIETSSRLRSEKDWLYLSIPMIHWADGFMPALTPLGFVLSKDVLLTVRFEHVKAFDNVLETISRHPALAGGPSAMARMPEDARRRCLSTSAFVRSLLAIGAADIEPELPPWPGHPGRLITFRLAPWLWRYSGHADCTGFQVG